MPVIQLLNYLTSTLLPLVRSTDAYIRDGSSRVGVPYQMREDHGLFYYLHWMHRERERGILFLCGRLGIQGFAFHRHMDVVDDAIELIYSVELIDIMLYLFTV